MMRYFWRLYYAFRPVRSHKLSEFLRSTARMQGVRLVEHRLVNRPRDTVDYRGVGWVNAPKDRAGLDGLPVVLRTRGRWKDELTKLLDQNKSDLVWHWVAGTNPDIAKALAELGIDPHSAFTAAEIYKRLEERSREHKTKGGEH